jgi:hypothetical protein
MDSSLFRRLIEGISPSPDTRSERSMQDHDLDDFVAFTVEEIAAIAALLHEERETANPVVPDETDPQEEDDIDWDDEDDVERSSPQMIPPLTTFYLEGLSKDIINGFAALQGTDEWRSAESNRRQIVLVVEALHLKPIKATFAEIGRLFGKSKGVILKEYEKSQLLLCVMFKAASQLRPRCPILTSPRSSRNIFDCFNLRWMTPRA